MPNDFWNGLKKYAGRLPLGCRVVGPQPPDGVELWWRADDKRYANYDPWADYDPVGSHLALELTPFVVRKHTPKGVWLIPYFGSDIFVLGTAIRQHAVPTIELAVRDLVARKRRHVSGCRARLQRAEEHLLAAERWLDLEMKAFEATK